MTKKQLSPEQKRLDADLWTIALITFGVFFLYAALGDRLMRFAKDASVSVVPRLLLSAGVQYGLSGLGITVVCLVRRESFAQFGLRRKNTVPALVGTALCFVPYLLCILLSGQFTGYRPLDIMLAGDVRSSGFPLSLLGMALIAVVWGFFEGFNYAVISEKINRRCPSRRPWLDWGALTCAAVCLLFHPMRFTFWGIVEILTVCLAIYGMLLVRRKTGNAWGCVFAFCLIWNAF